MSNLILVVGGTSSGKSPYVKNMIANKNCLVFDYQNEYGATNKYGEANPDVLPNDILQKRCRVFCSPEQFITIMKTRTNTVIVWEEATGFFAGKIGKLLVQEILSKAHTGNNFVFIFHSIQRIPKAIIEFANYLILFRTGDNLEDVKKRLPKAVNYLYDLQTKPVQGKCHVIHLQ